MQTSQSDPTNRSLQNKQINSKFTKLDGKCVRTKHTKGKIRQSKKLCKESLIALIITDESIELITNSQKKETKRNYDLKANAILVNNSQYTDLLNVCHQFRNIIESKPKGIIRV